MSTPNQTTRKRQHPNAGNGSAFSQSLRNARNFISSGNHGQALTALNQLAAANQNPAKRARILLLIGESQTTLSRHGEAATAFSRASQFARQASDYDLFLRAGTGQVKSLLRALRTDEAKAAAVELLSEIQTAQQQLQSLLNLTPAQLAAQGSLVVPARPPRVTVSLTSVANAFIESGLTNDARAFLLQATQLAPNGASRARQVLARLALASDEPANAERFARESLLMGRFQAKTIAAWQLYLDARARQNLVPILEPDVLASLLANSHGRIASASLATIVRVLRGHGDPQWRVVAASAISSPTSDSIIRVELEKIIQADAKLTGSAPPPQIAARAMQLFQAGNVSAQEQVAHAKAYVRFSIAAGNIPDMGTPVIQAVNRYGPEHGIAVRHSMALGAILAQDYDTARGCLLTLKSELPEGSEAWGKATWALARMEVDLNNKGDASTLYLSIASNNLTPGRFRIQAMLRGLKLLAESGGNIDIHIVSQSIQSILAGTIDFRIALDAARQLALAGSAFLELKDDAVKRGVMLADQAFSAATSPQEALNALEYLSRKLHCDLIGYPGPVISRWESLSLAQKAEFSRTGGSIWYEYLATIFKSFISLGRANEASAVASSVIDGDKSTPEGYVIVGIEYAAWLLGSDQAKAFECFEWISTEAPSHRKAALAHYWLMVRNLKLGTQADALLSAQAIRKCFGGSPSLLTEWELDGKACLVIHAGDKQAAMNASGVATTLEFLETLKQSLAHDLLTLS